MLFSLSNLPGLSSVNNGRQVLLTIDGKVGQSLFESCIWTTMKNEIALYKASRIIRKELFSKEEVFIGDVSNQRQSESVPQKLIQLISILEGAQPDRIYYQVSKG